MLTVDTYVAASPIEGVGVFAAEPIARGTLVWRFDPTFDLLVAESVYDAAPGHLKRLLDRYAYPSSHQPGHRVLEAGNGRFMNHAASPNTDFSRDGGGWATADIAVGEEITCDYAQFYDDFTDLHAVT